MKAASRKAPELWRHENMDGRRAFLEGLATKMAREIVDEGGVLAWNGDEMKDPGNRIKNDLDFDAIYRRAMAALGRSRDDDDAFAVMTDIANDVAVRAYLVGVAVGRRLA